MKLLIMQVPAAIRYLFFIPKVSSAPVHETLQRLFVP